MPDNTAPSPSIMPLIAGYIPARLIFLAAELGVADLIADGTTTVEGLAQRTGMHASSLKRMLRALCAYDVLIAGDNKVVPVTDAERQLLFDTARTVDPALRTGASEARRNVISPQSAGPCQWERSTCDRAFAD